MKSNRSTLIFVIIISIVALFGTGCLVPNGYGYGPTYGSYGYNYTPSYYVAPRPIYVGGRHYAPAPGGYGWRPGGGVAPAARPTYRPTAPAAPHFGGGHGRRR
jgi:hypothetical protein